MNDTPETDKYVNRDWWTLFRANEHARDLERARDEARELHRNALREREATEKGVDAMLERAHKAERERDEARKELEEYRSIAENIGAVKAVSEKEKAICERNETLEKLIPLRQSLCDSQDEVLRLTFENRELNQGIDEALIQGNKLADECERILGLGLHQNTIERFKAALEAWKKYNNE